jgi:hypothetical protein
VTVYRVLTKYCKTKRKRKHGSGERVKAAALTCGKRRQRRPQSTNALTGENKEKRRSTFSSARMSPIDCNQKAAKRNRPSNNDNDDDRKKAVVVSLGTETVVN